MNVEKFKIGNKYVVIMGGDRTMDGLNGEYTLTGLDGSRAEVTNSRGQKETVDFTNMYTHDELARTMNEWWEPGY